MQGGEDASEPQGQDGMRWDAQPSNERNQQSPLAARLPSWMQSKAPDISWSMTPVPGAYITADSMQSKTRGCAQ